MSYCREWEIAVTLLKEISSVLEVVTTLNVCGDWHSLCLYFLFFILVPATRKLANSSWMLSFVRCSHLGPQIMDCLCISLVDLLPTVWNRKLTLIGAGPVQLPCPVSFTMCFEASSVIWKLIRDSSVRRDRCWGTSFPESPSPPLCCSRGSYVCFRI